MAEDLEGLNFSISLDSPVSKSSGAFYSKQTTQSLAASKDSDSKDFFFSGLASILTGTQEQKYEAPGSAFSDNPMMA